MFRKELIHMADDVVARNLQSMDELDFTGWNRADWDVFAHYHTDDVLVDFHGQPPTHGIREHIDAMKAFIDTTGGTPLQVKSHPIGFGSGEWTCTVGELETGGRMVTVAKWRDGAIAEEYIWL
jgi:SnoaL-like domain